MYVSTLFRPAPRVLREVQRMQKKLSHMCGWLWWMVLPFDVVSLMVLVHVMVYETICIFTQIGLGVCWCVYDGSVAGECAVSMGVLM